MTGTVYIPSRQRVIIAPETTPGTVATTGGILCPTSGLTSSSAGGVYTEDADLGIGVSNFSISPNGGRAATISWSELVRADACVMFLLFGMLGKGTDATPTGSVAPYTHLGTINGGLPQTYSVFHDTGKNSATLEYLQYLEAMPTDIALSWSPTQPPMASIQMAALTGTPVTASGSVPPSIACYTTAEHVQMRDGAYVYQSSATTASLASPYPVAGNIVSGTLHFARAATPTVVGDALDAPDIVPGTMTMDGSFELIYRGAAAVTPYADWLLWQKQGVMAHANSIIWTPADGNSIAIKWDSLTMTSCEITPGSDALHVTVNFASANSLVAANQASPIGTAPTSITVLNGFASSMA